MTGLSAGSLTARVRCRGQDIDAIDLVLERPVHVLAGLCRKTPADCLRLLPLLFPLCGTAHALAALQAIEAATALTPGPAQQAARDTLALADRCAAQVWRSCIDWASLLGAQADSHRVAQARQWVGRIARALYPDGDWQRIGGGRLAPDAGALVAAREGLQHLREGLELDRWQSKLRSQAMDALSGVGDDWQGFVDGRFADMIDATAAAFTQLDNQLAALTGLPPTAAATAALPLRPGHGSGMALSARGELHYQFEIDDARVSACRMSAPTDRAFASDGPVARRLQGLRHADQPVLAVRWVLAAFDPCIEVRVEAAAA